MANDDFDLDFDFDKEYDFDPKILSGDDGLGDDIDLSQFSDEELGLKSQEDGSEDPGDFDLDFDVNEFLGDEDAELPEEPIADDVPEFAKRGSSSRFGDAGYGATPEFPADAVPTELDEEPPMEELPPEEELPVDEDGEPSQDPAEDSSEASEKPRRKPRKPKKEPKEKKPAKPTIFNKFFDLYFAPVLNKELLEEPKDPNAPRRRRKTKAQIFKEAYLPAIVVCVSLILVLSFAIGALSNGIKQHNLDKEAKKSQLQASISASQQEESDAQIALEQAKALATVYNYDDAIDVLGDFLGAVDTADYPEHTALRAEYLETKSRLVIHQDPSLIPNLSFHVLIHDMAKAKQSAEFGGQYNKNFVTTSEFTKILGELYNNGYVLVDFDSFTTNNNGTILPKNISLPEGKQPIMLTETLVNYFEYMTDHNKDGTQNDGDGFANKLVVDANGDIKAEYVDSNGNTLVGDYDFVPILETFLKEHPDFSYQGARATLAVTGSEGIFGYRINSSFVASRGASYQEAQISGARTLVNALREKGYTLACFTYNNENYGKFNANLIQEDLNQWTQQITPVIGSVDVLVYAREADITDYSGASFKVMSDLGFRYFVSNAASPSTEVNSNYVRQKRLMVTGNSLVWKQTMFNNIFDPNAVVDLATRGDVPN